jgi:hypothetical protein
MEIRVSPWAVQLLLRAGARHSAPARAELELELYTVLNDTECRSDCGHDEWTSEPCSPRLAEALVDRLQALGVWREP